MKSTTEYFKKTAEELLAVDGSSRTKEESLLFKEGLMVVFRENEEECKNFLENQRKNLPKLDFKMALKTVKGEIAVILN